MENTLLLKDGNHLPVTREVEQKIDENIAAYGGGFARKLWAAYRHADAENSRILLAAFNNLFTKYYSI